MRGATLAFGLGSAAIALAVALRMLLSGGDSLQPTSPIEPSSRTIEPTREEAQPPRPLPAERDLAEPALEQTDGPSDTSAADRRATCGVASADENPACERLRQQAMRDIQAAYSLLFEDLDLPTQEQADLVALLAQMQSEGAWTSDTRGRTISAQERSDRIADLIGDPKLQEFLALESNLVAYSESQRIALLLQRNSVPLTQTQREGLFDILVGVRDWYQAPPAKIESIEQLEQFLIQLDEYERHVVELAPSVLSANQVVHLFERYQRGSRLRADALALQRKFRAEHPGEEVACSIQRAVTSTSGASR